MRASGPRLVSGLSLALVLGLGGASIGFADDPATVPSFPLPSDTLPGDNVFLSFLNRIDLPVSACQYD